MKIINFIIMLMMISLTSFVFAECSDGIISYWTMDNSDYSGTDVYDVVDGNDGIIDGATSGQIGQVNESLSFDGSANYLTVSDDVSLDFGTGDFTLEALGLFRCY